MSDLVASNNKLVNENEVMQQKILEKENDCELLNVRISQLEALIDEPKRNNNKNNIVISGISSKDVKKIIMSISDKTKAGLKEEEIGELTYFSGVKNKTNGESEADNKRIIVKFSTYEAKNCFMNAKKG
jgi:hypothetical protein